MFAFHIPFLNTRQYTHQFYYFPDSDKAPMFVRIKKCEQTTCGSKKKFLLLYRWYEGFINIFSAAIWKFSLATSQKKRYDLSYFFRELQLCQALNCSHFFKDAWDWILKRVYVGCVIFKWMDLIISPN